MTRKSIPLTLVCLLPFLSGACQGPTQASEGAHPQAGAEAEMAEMMARMEELATPGPQHALLNSMVGTFRAEFSMWAAPGMDAVTMTGTMINSWILGGRYVQSDYTSEWMGEPFHGLGLMGYDISQEAYVGTWCDTASTILAPISVGQLSADGSQISMVREMVDPISGILTRTRDVFTLTSQDQHTMETYSRPEGQDEFLMMRIDYTRTR